MGPQPPQMACWISKCILDKGCVFPTDLCEHAHGSSLGNKTSNSSKTPGPQNYLYYLFLLQYCLEAATELEAAIG